MSDRIMLFRVMVEDVTRNESQEVCKIVSRKINEVLELTRNNTLSRETVALIVLEARKEIN